MRGRGTRSYIARSALPEDYWFLFRDALCHIEKTSPVGNALYIADDYIRIGVLAEILQKVRCIEVALVTVAHRLIEMYAQPRCCDRERNAHRAAVREHPRRAALLGHDAGEISQPSIGTEYPHAVGAYDP